jgi:hypothetical protein
MFQEKSALLRDKVPLVNLRRCDQICLFPILNIYRDDDDDDDDDAGNV